MSKIDKDSRLGIQMKNELTNHVEDELIDEHLSVKRNATDISNNPAQGTLDTKPKANKSTFKVTSVILHADESGREHVVSVVDEEDESGLDGSLLQVGEDEQMPQFSAADKRHERVDSSSRFKVVKINKKEPYVRGRWRVLDFMSEADIASTRVVEGSSKKGSESGNSSRASSHHYVHGIDDPSKNPLAAIFPYPSTLPTIQQSNAGVQASDEMLVDDSGSEDANLDQTNALVTEANTHHVTFGATNYIDEPHDGSSDRLNDNQRNATDGSQHNSIIGFQPPLGLLQAGQHISSANTVLNEATVLSENVAPTQHSTQVVNPPGVPLPILPDVKPLPVLINLQKETFDLRETAKADESAKPNVYNSVAPLESVLTVLTPSVAMEPENQKQEEPDPTTSVVAIDNKIEQAMDLVKSHLMLAVREEVEELRLQIKQLIERNNQLEQENKILRTSATPETLAQLNLLSRQQHIHSNPK